MGIRNLTPYQHVLLTDIRDLWRQRTLPDSNHYHIDSLDRGLRDIFNVRRLDYLPLMHFLTIKEDVLKRSIDEQTLFMLKRMLHSLSLQFEFGCISDPKGKLKRGNNHSTEDKIAQVLEMAIPTAP